MIPTAGLPAFARPTTQGTHLTESSRLAELHK